MFRINLITIVLIISFKTLLIGDNNIGNSECVDTSAVKILLSYPELSKNITFRSFSTISEKDSNLIAKHHKKWYFLNAKGDTLTDIEFLREIDLDKQANMLQNEFNSKLKRKKVQLAVGIPAGVLFVYGGSWWLGNYESGGNDTPTLDNLIGGLAISTGVIIGATVVWSYLKNRKQPVDKHKITFIQATNMVSRYNELIQIKCNTAD